MLEHYLDEIVLLQKNLPQPTLAARIVLQIELVKPVESVLISMYIQQIHIEIVTG